MVMPGIVLAVGLGLIHGFASQLPVEILVPRHRWTSFAGGISLGYVFLEVFPELSHAQEELVHSKAPFLAYLENHIYLVALFGLIIFYGLDKIALKIQDKTIDEPSSQSIGHSLSISHSLFFWLHILVFAFLNGILGYLLQDLAEHSLFSCVLLFLTLALHMFIIDEGLREHHRAIYDRVGRWLLVSAVIVGMILGQSWHLNEAAVSIVWSFLAGSIILHVLKRELPPEKDTCLVSFMGGSLLFAVLLNLR